MRNEVANLERQVLEAKKAALQKQLQALNAANPVPTAEDPVAQPGGARNSNFGSFYEHEGEDSHLVEVCVLIYLSELLKLSWGIRSLL